MKQKIKKLSKKENQRILCEVVNVFIQNEVNDNYEIIKMFSQLNPDKLRGVKRSLTEKKKKLSRASKKPMDHFKGQEKKFIVGLDLQGKMGEIAMRRLQKKKSPVEQTTPQKNVYGSLAPEIRKFIAFTKFLNQNSENLYTIEKNEQNKCS
jgi:hypothetical protein